MAAYISQLKRSFSTNPASSNAGQSLPTGACNFRDLSNGISAPRCGCTRFWLNAQQPGREREWCFCGHHACFHETLSQLPTDSELFRHPLPPQVQQPEGRFSLETSPRRAEDALPATLQPAGLGIRSSSQQQLSGTQHMHKRVWDALTAYARDGETGPPSVISSKLPSTRTPSIADDATTLNHHRRPICPTVEIPTHPLIPGHVVAEQYSATEVATPSAAGTPDLRTVNALNTQYRDSPSNIRPSNLICGRQSSQPRTSQRPSVLPNLLPAEGVQSAAAGPSFQSSVHIQEFMRSFGRRLEALENMSFSQVPADEVHDKFEYFEGRLLELEHWKADQDQIEPSPVFKHSTAPEANSHRHQLPIGNHSFSSDASFDSSAAAYTEAAVLATLAANSETVPRIEVLEARLSDLEQAALPSFARPWKIQVVVLPWGKDLGGVWFSSAESTQSYGKPFTPTEEEWPISATAPKSSFAASTETAWTTESIEAWAAGTEDWLSPKACGPHGTVFQRLASRGLVQELTMTGSDAHHIFAVIRDAFEPILWPDGFSPRHSRGSYHALRQPFVPLRKVRKSTRLRFLSQAEMVTPAAWSAGFLDSSVVMKVGDGVRRLYVTTPDAYLQSDAEEWSWRRLRSLPLYDASGDEMSAHAQGVVIESCWSYQQRLDVPRSSRSSFASSTSPWASRFHDEAGGDDAVSDERSPRSPHYTMFSTGRRTASLEAVEISSPPAPVAKRRVASLDSSQIRQHESKANAKKRRVTASPEAERRGVGLTPRWSREPPSPHASDALADQRRRATTPFAYATPHSNNLGTMDVVLGDGDTEADTEDLEMAHSPHAEDEWQGVDEEASSSPSASRASTSNGAASTRRQGLSP